MSTAHTEAKQIRLMGPHELADHELRALGTIASGVQERMPYFASWIIEIVSTEIAAREFRMEPQSFSLPEWTAKQTGEALLSSLIFTQYPLTNAMAEWLDDVHKIVVCSAVGMLEGVTP